ncbi:L,D-transpeptidase [Raineyella antarctica]|uniref:L,D-transpeptidase n=1 Tax=Raineyella antarctica TaxID=1577474 RepID=UPI001FE1EC36|nr:L,D-transpeptidase [Raineyella antarctica]
MRTLQEALDRNKQRDYFAYSRGYTTYFGSSTKSALMNWEKANSRTRGVSVNGTIVVNSAKWNLLMSQRRASSGSDSRCMTGARVLCVSKKDNKVRYMKNGKVIYTLDARFGSAETPTRSGSYKVYWKSRYHVSSLYHTSMPYAMFFSGGQAVHYSPDFAARGYRGASHGCVNIRDRATIATIFAEVRTGDKVIVY